MRNLHEVPNDEYRYIPFSIERLLIEAGFVDIEIKAAWRLACQLGADDRALGAASADGFETAKAYQYDCFAHR